MSTVTRTEIRGQCEKGHVLIAEVFGPELVDQWMCSCPLPDCGFDITWQRRPDWVPGHSLLGPLVAARKADLAATWGTRAGSAARTKLFAEAIKVADAAIEKES